MQHLTTFESLPPELWAWLRYPLVITDKLKQVCQHVQMEVLSHEQVLADPWERHFLKEFSLIRREILMRGDGVQCWFARTMIPQTTYESDQVFFDRLHREPLSHLIFDEPTVCRYLLHSYGIDAKNAEYHWVTPKFQQNAAHLWMRLSYFKLHAAFPFYLAEVFLPDLLRVSKGIECLK